MIQLSFNSQLHCSRQTAWDWITSVEGISRELHPLIRMSVPGNIHNLADVKVQPGTRLFRSYLFLFGVLPMDFSDLTLVDFNPLCSFKEQSPMGSMKLWIHERFLVDATDGSGDIILSDRLTFQPRFASGFVAWFVNKLFTHRHEVLRRTFLKPAITMV